MRCMDEGGGGGGGDLTQTPVRSSRPQSLDKRLPQLLHMRHTSSGRALAGACVGVALLTSPPSPAPDPGAVRVAVLTSRSAIVSVLRTGFWPTGDEIPFSSNLEPSLPASLPHLTHTHTTLGTWRRWRQGTHPPVHLQLLLP